MEKGLFDYFTVEEVAEKSGLKANQVLRLGMSGAIILSILEHEPRNFEEISEYVDEEGQNIRKTRRSETSTIVGVQNPGLQIKYISTEDVINVVTNEAENRKTLIRALFETRDLDPKKGKWLLNSPRSIEQNDLIINAEEWSFFEKEEGKKLVDYLPLKRPEKVTIPWLFKNVSFSAWLSAGGLAVAMFLAGVSAAETGLYKDIRSKILPSYESKQTLKSGKG